MEPSRLRRFVEYMDQEKWKEAEVQVPIVGQVLENVASRFGKAADDLEKRWRRAVSIKL